jgi:hypothetical protein
MLAEFFPQSLRLPSVAAAMMVWAAWLAIPADAIAGCGDYLLPPIEIAKQQSLPAEMIAAGYKAPHQAPPCRGPNCHHAPRHDLPTPAPVVIVVSDHWACPPSVAVVTLTNVASWTTVAATLSLRDTSFRLDRPPRG